MDIPPELIVHVFSYLSPPDVLSLAATSKKHYNVWQQNSNTICKLISPAVQCQHDARRLLADQGFLQLKKVRSEEFKVKSKELEGMTLVLTVNIVQHFSKQGQGRLWL
ncbi:hypothetical protein AJ79_09722 [Helicocarpus griseus UAMH5409]|uniref:F-box domain-containing protein n=1 Tax=Helicocarpus griseus UAMH5409 TaxID=1447875 RepID=A0A2B7WH98_9EURO|nr:hypothetical protein AJ79_09722 [Helicocarpus griseus UAMH5409]